MNVRTVVAASTPAFVPARAPSPTVTGWIAALSLALGAILTIAGPVHAQAVKEFAAGITQAPAPRGVVLGSDGNIWFTEQTGNRIGRITPAGVVTEFSAGLSPGVNPGGMALGSDNNVWFVERTGNRIGRITPAGVITEFPLPHPNSVPVSIAAGPDGGLWFVENTGNRVGRIDPTTGTITEFSAGISANAGLNGIFAGPDGNLWFTEGNANKIGQITTGGAVTEYSTGITAGAAPNDIKNGPDGNLWFTEINGNRIARITTSGNVTEYGAGITAGASPRNLVVGPDNNLWFTETTGNRIGQIVALIANGTVGTVTEFSTGITAGAQPWGIATGSDGNLWFTELAAGQIGQMTTAGAVLAEFNSGITPGAAPFWIAPGPDGNLWFTEPAIDAIGRITPLGVVTEFRGVITPGSSPIAIVTGPDNNLWFTEYNGNRIGRITTSGAVTEFSAGITAGSSPAGIAVGPDNNIWFTEETGSRIGRIIALPANGTVGTVTEFGLAPGAGPADIKAGPDGNLWFAETGANQIGRITPAGAITEFNTGITAGAGPQGIALGPDNNMWFTETNAARIGKIIALPANGTVGTVTEFVGIPGQTEFITAGPDGNLWFTMYTTNRIGRITPAGVFTTFPAGITANAGLEAITAGPDGNLWFAENNINRVARITTTSDFVVTNNNDSGVGSLRDAVALANVAAGAPTISFAPAVKGTILLTSGQINVNRGMTITGPGAGTLTIDGNAAGRIFSIFLTDPACPAIDGTDYLVSISGLHLTNARRTQSNAGGAIFTEHSLALDGMTFDNNVAAVGGGLYFQAQYAGQTLTINNSQFLNNKAQPIGPSDVSDSGGAMVVFERCAGVHVAPVVTISGSVFSGNQALPVGFNGFGGAIDMDTIGSATITDTRIINNQVVLPAAPPATQIYRSGGLHVHMKSLRIERSEISGNSLVDATASDLTRGGGMVAFNTAADLQGAGDTMNAMIVNSTISGNSSPATAGAMLISGNVAMEIDNSTVANNTAPQTRTGGIAMGVGAGQLAPTLTLVSSILAKNSSDGGDIAASVAQFPAFTINANNSAIQTICPLPSCNITVSGSGNLLATDPLLGPLANHGGPTQTQALLAGSPAIDAGSNPQSLTTDQRGTGFPRVIGGAADMGAYEYNPVVAAPVLQGIVSRKVHGTSGTFDRPLTFTTPPTINHAPTTEPRAGPTFQLVFTFDKPLSTATATVTEGVATPSSSIVGSTVVVDLTAVNDAQYVTVSLTNVGSTDGGSGGVAAARVGFLRGDVNANRLVAVTDLVVVNNQLGKPLTAANYVSDVNTSGIITVLDKVVVNNALGHFLPAP